MQGFYYYAGQKIKRIPRDYQNRGQGFMPCYLTASTQQLDVIDEVIAVLDLVSALFVGLIPRPEVGTFCTLWTTVKNSDMRHQMTSL
jgi:hypothetical protein